MLPIGRTKNGPLILSRISDLVLAFLDDKLEEAVASVSTIELEEVIVGVEKDGKPKRKLMGNVGDVIIQ